MFKNKTSLEEIKIQGQGAGSGIAIGEIVLLDTKVKPVKPTSIEKSAVKNEKKRFLKARDQLIKELELLKDEVKAKNSQEIVDTQRQITNDPEIEKNVFELIENNLLSADFAIYQSYSQFIERLQDSGSELFQQRIVDLEDVRDRLISIISDKKESKPIKKGAILVAAELSPTDLINYYEDGITGIIMDKGGQTSHAAIIAQSLKIPCVVSAKKAVKAARKSKNVIIDGESGEVFFNPEKSRLKEYKRRLKAARKLKKKRPKQEAFQTTDGFPFRLFANIEFDAEIPNVKESEAPGIGLLRTECLLFGKHSQTKAEEQVGFYQSVLDGVAGPVTIRLFDVGGDKLHTRSGVEPNPFLGWRGIRMLLDEKELLRNQLKAILQVAGKNPGRIKILVPMVSVLDEVLEIREEMEAIQAALLSAGEKIDENVPLGVMVEVPSVALSAYQFAKEVDFFSMGTNDLTQYTLAVDRGNEHITSLFQHYHPSVLRLIKLTVKGAGKAEVEVSACGELAGTEIGAACMFGLGIKELSMTPSSIAKIKDLLTSRSKVDFERLAADAIEAATSEEVEQLFKNWKNID